MSMAATASDVTTWAVTGTAPQAVSAASRITLAPELLYSSPKLRELKLELLLRLPFREALHHERTHHCLAPLQLRAQMSDEQYARCVVFAAAYKAGKTVEGLATEEVPKEYIFRHGVRIGRH